jgi:hypothetical protein
LGLKFNPQNNQTTPYHKPHTCDYQQISKSPTSQILNAK